MSKSLTSNDLLSKNLVGYKRISNLHLSNSILESDMLPIRDDMVSIGNTESMLKAVYAYNLLNKFSVIDETTSNLYSEIVELDNDYVAVTGSISSLASLVNEDFTVVSNELEILNSALVNDFNELEFDIASSSALIVSEILDGNLINATAPLSFAPHTSSASTINLKIGDGLMVTGNNELDLAVNVTEYVGALSSISIPSLVEDMPSVSRVSLKTSSDFDQSSGTLRIAGGEDTLIPYYSALTGFSTDVNFSWHQVSETLQANNVLLNPSNLLYTGNYACPINFMSGYNQPAAEMSALSATPIGEEGEAYKSWSVRFDDITLGLNTENQLKVRCGEGLMTDEANQAVSVSIAPNAGLKFVDGELASSLEIGDGLDNNENVVTLDQTFVKNLISSESNIVQYNKETGVITDDLTVSAGIQREANNLTLDEAFAKGLISSGTAETLEVTEGVVSLLLAGDEISISQEGAVLSVNEEYLSTQIEETANPLIESAVSSAQAELEGQIGTAQAELESQMTAMNGALEAEIGSACAGVAGGAAAALSAAMFGASLTYQPAGSYQPSGNYQAAGNYAQQSDMSNIQSSLSNLKSLFETIEWSQTNAALISSSISALGNIFQTLTNSNLVTLNLSNSISALMSSSGLLSKTVSVLQSTSALMSSSLAGLSNCTLPSLCSTSFYGGSSFVNNLYANDIQTSTLSSPQTNTLSAIFTMFQTAGGNYTLNSQLIPLTASISGLQSTSSLLTSSVSSIYVTLPSILSTISSHTTSLNSVNASISGLSLTTIPNLCVSNYYGNNAFMNSYFSNNIQTQTLTSNQTNTISTMYLQLQSASSQYVFNSQIATLTQPISLSVSNLYTQVNATLSGMVATESALWAKLNTLSSVYQTISSNYLFTSALTPVNSSISALQSSSALIGSSIAGLFVNWATISGAYQTASNLYVFQTSLSPFVSYTQGSLLYGNLSTSNLVSTSIAGLHSSWDTITSLLSSSVSNLYIAIQNSISALATTVSGLTSNFGAFGIRHDFYGGVIEPSGNSFGTVSQMMRIRSQYNADSNSLFLDGNALSTRGSDNLTKFTVTLTDGSLWTAGNFIAQGNSTLNNATANSITTTNLLVSSLSAPQITAINLSVSNLYTQVSSMLMTESALWAKLNTLSSVYQTISSNYLFTSALTPFNASISALQSSSALIGSSIAGLFVNWATISGAYQTASNLYVFQTSLSPFVSLTQGSTLYANLTASNQISNSLTALSSNFQTANATIAQICITNNNGGNQVTGQPCNFWATSTGFYNSVLIGGYLNNGTLSGTNASSNLFVYGYCSTASLYANNSSLVNLTLSNLNVNGSIALNYAPIYLHGGGDQFHYIQYDGTVDGARIQSYSGGKLSTYIGNSVSALVWNGVNTSITNLYGGGFNMPQPDIFGPVLQTANTSTTGSLLRIRPVFNSDAQSLMVDPSGMYLRSGQNSNTFTVSNTNGNIWSAGDLYCNDIYANYFIGCTNLNVNGSLSCPQITGIGQSISALSGSVSTLMNSGFMGATMSSNLFFGLTQGNLLSASLSSLSTIFQSASSLYANATNLSILSNSVSACLTTIAGHSTAITNIGASISSLLGSITNTGLIGNTLSQLLYYGMTNGNLLATSLSGIHNAFDTITSLVTTSLSNAYSQINVTLSALNTNIGYYNTSITNLKSNAVLTNISASSLYLNATNVGAWISNVNTSINGLWTNPVNANASISNLFSTNITCGDLRINSTSLATWLSNENSNIVNINSSISSIHIGFDTLASLVTTSLSNAYSQINASISGLSTNLNNLNLNANFGNLTLGNLWLNSGARLNQSILTAGIAPKDTNFWQIGANGAAYQAAYFNYATCTDILCSGLPLANFNKPMAHYNFSCTIVNGTNTIGGYSLSTNVNNIFSLSGNSFKSSYGGTVNVLVNYEINMSGLAANADVMSFLNVNGNGYGYCSQSTGTTSNGNSLFCSGTAWVQMSNTSALTLNAACSGGSNNIAGYVQLLVI